MLDKRVFKFSLLILAVSITLYSAFSEFAIFLYNSQLDILLRAMSGLWVSLVILGLALYFGTFVSLKDYKVKSFLIAFVSATLIGVVWELIRNYYKLTDVLADNYNFITAMHILTNAIGGTLAHFYFVKRKKSKAIPPEFQYPFKA